MNFCDAHLPVNNMVQHPEVENRIEGFIRIRKVIDTPDCKDNATLKFPCESLLCSANLQGVEVESIDLTCSELLQHYLHSNTPAASDIEYARAIKSATQLP